MRELSYRRLLVPVLAVLLVGACASAAAVPAPQGTTPTGSSGQAAGAAGGFRLAALPEPAPFDVAEYGARRQALHREMEDGVLVVFGSPHPAFDYLPFAQTADFRYLTGIMEPGAAYIAVKRGGRVEERLFMDRRDPAREQWEGVRLGPEGATRRTGIAAFTNDRTAPVLDSLVAAHGVLYSTTVPPVTAGLDANLSYDQQVLMRLRERHPGMQIRSMQGAIRQLRGVKSATELDRIRRAVQVSVLAHREAMRSVQPGMNEFEIRALMEFFFRRYGAEGPAYSSIVGSGPNSTILHYQASDRFMVDGDVLLIDAAASYGGYAADVTRTFPVNGRFTPEQRAIYEVVLAAQKAAESRVRPGATWTELTAAATTELRSGMARLGLIDAPDATYECRRPGGTGACPQAALWYMHGLGHGVGLAVHDPDISQTPAGFRPGSAVTIEPGIYIRPEVLDDIADTPANRAMLQRLRPAVQRYANIGVRIEDVVILGESGVERVSAGVPREIEEIEALMRERGLLQSDRRAEVVDWFRRTRGR